MANLELVTFTTRSDQAISPLGEGWVLGPGKAVDSLAGNDTITGTGVGISGLALSGKSTLDTGNGNDTITGTATAGITLPGVGVVGLISGIDLVASTLKTGNGSDVINGSSTAGHGIYLEDSAIDTGNARDIVTGASTGTGTYGIYLDSKSTLATGNGNDIVDALVGGFGGDGTVNLGNGSDILKGFGTGEFNGGNGPDRILLGAGTYMISGGVITMEGLTSMDMNVSGFELIGGTKGSLFAFADGSLTVDSSGNGVFTAAL